MGDLISRKEMIRAVDSLGECYISYYKLLMLICQLPPAEPERKKGKWVVTSEFEDCRYVKCDQCKVTQVFYYNKPLTNFCPNCGAEMMNRGES